MRVFDVISFPCYMESVLMHSQLAPCSAYVTKNSYIRQWTEKYGLGVPARKSLAVGLSPSSPQPDYRLQGFSVRSLARKAATT